MTQDANKSEARGAKRWGPFTGHHLTIMFVALIVGAVAIPASAWAAVTFSNVAITDPGGVNRAKVDWTGSLQTNAPSEYTPGRTVFNATLTVHFTDQSPFSNNPAITVPAGKRFIIRNVNIYASVPTGQLVPDAVLNLNNATGHTFSHSFPVSFAGHEPTGTDALVSQNASMIYAGGGTQITALAVRSASTGTGVVTFTLSGDLVTCSNSTPCSASEALAG